jgi:hypothetical protein
VFLLLYRLLITELSQEAVAVAVVEEAGRMRVGAVSDVLAVAVAGV